MKVFRPTFSPLLNGGSKALQAHIVVVIRLDDTTVFEFCGTLAALATQLGFGHNFPCLSTPNHA